MRGKPLTIAHWPATEADLVVEQTVGALLRRAAEQAPDARALVEGVDGDSKRTWTYAALLADAERAARALLGRFAPGERVAVWANNIPEWIVLDMAAALAGIVLVTVNPALRPGELRYVLGQSGSAGVFLVDEYRGTSLVRTLAEVRAELPRLREAVSFREWPEFLASGSPTELLPHVAPGDPAQIQYTSGTTGVPKGAVLHHRGIVNSARLSYERVLGLRSDDVLVNPMPLFHTAGCVLATLSTIATLGTQVLMPSFDPGLQLRLIESERGTVLYGVPTMLLGVLDHADFATTDVSSLRCSVSGGATVPPQLVARVEEATGAPLAIIYAQTEASPGISMTRLDDSAEDRRTTLGRPLAGVEVKIADPADDRTPVRPGVVGELCTRGYHVMTGYLDQPEQTSATIDAAGWLHTGDLASMDERGYCRIEGRRRDMIIRGGENIYPREIEQVLQDHPHVLDVAVLGLPDQTWGEQVAAFVVLAPDAPEDDTVLFDHVRAHLAPHKTPKIWRFVAGFPLTGSGKIQKFALRDEYVAERIDGTAV